MEEMAGREKALKKQALLPSPINGRGVGGEGSYDFLVFGEYCCDLIVTGLPELPRLGADIFGSGMGIEVGAAFNTVRALHRLGVRVGWAAQFGSDLFSQFALEQVRAEGVDTRLLVHVDRPLRSISLSFSFTHERGFISYTDPVEPLDRVRIIRENPARCVLFTGLEYGEGLLAAVGAAHQVGAIAAMDCQHATATLETPGVAAALQAVDLFLPNAGEAMQLTGAASPVEALRILARHSPQVVVKQGAQGALAGAGDELLCAEAIPVEEVIDTTGAGDCFNAGFLRSYLRGDDLLTCLRYGNICGGLAITAHAACATPTACQAEELFRRLYFSE
jgi:sugar/nucleoside kinase (ribokinase family)